MRSFSEVEIEQIADGAERLIERIERQLRAAGARRSDGRPKVFQALDLPAPAGRRQAQGAGGRAPPRLPAGADRLAADSDPPRAAATAAGCTACGWRRAACAARSRRRGGCSIPAGWRDADELKWLGAVLGEVRDSDVFAAYVEREVERLGGGRRQGGADLAALIGERSRPSRAQLAAALDSPRYLALLDRLEEIEGGLPVGRSASR